MLEDPDLLVDICNHYYRGHLNGHFNRVDYVQLSDCGSGLLRDLQDLKLFVQTKAKVGEIIQNERLQKVDFKAQSDLFPRAASPHKSGV